MSTLGQPSEFANCVAEIEEGNPWTPLRVDLGHSKGSNLVTVVTAESYQAIVGLGLTSEQFLSLLTDRLVGLHSPRMGVMLLILNYDTVDILHGDGWTKDGLKKYIAEHAVMPASEFKKRFNRAASEAPGAPDSIPAATGSSKAMIPTPAIDQLLILVAGGPPGEKDMIVPVWGSSKAVSREVKLPANWKEVLAAAGK
jgi:hypothetical protein